MKTAMESGRKKHNIEYWIKRYIDMIKGLSHTDIKLIESYRPTIRQRIDNATRWDNFQHVENLDDKKACLELEELIYYIPKILSSTPPTYEYVSRGVERIAQQRKYSWKGDGFLKKEYFDIRIIDLISQIIRNDQDMTHVDFAQKGKDGSYSLFGHNVSNTSPQDYLVISKNWQMLHDAIQKVCSSGKYAKEMKIIIEMMQDGIDVSCKHAEIVGIPSKKMASVKNQTLNKLRKAFQKIAGDPELVNKYAFLKKKEEEKKREEIKATKMEGNEDQTNENYGEAAIEKSDGGKKRKKKKGERQRAIKSTANDRKAQYKQEKVPPIYTRVWKRINGNLVLTYDNSNSTTNDLCASPKTKSNKDKGTSSYKPQRKFRLVS